MLAASGRTMAATGRSWGKESKNQQKVISVCRIKQKRAKATVIVNIWVKRMRNAYNLYPCGLMAYMKPVGLPIRLNASTLSARETYRHSRNLPRMTNCCGAWAYRKNTYLYLQICSSSLGHHFQKGRTTLAGGSLVIFWQTRPLKSYDVYWYLVNEWVGTKISTRQNYQYLLIAVRSLNNVRKETSDLHKRKHLHNKWLYGNNKGPHLDHSHDMDRLGYLRRWNS